MSNDRTEDIGRFAAMFAALSNVNRARIFLRLAHRCGNKAACYSDDEVCSCVGELGADLGIAPSTVSHHIKELNRAGLINMERCGRRVRCWIDAETVNELADFFNQALIEQPQVMADKAGVSPSKS